MKICGLGCVLTLHTHPDRLPVGSWSEHLHVGLPADSWLVWLICSYDGPYTGRKELAGCGGGQPAISKQPPVTQHQVVADWTAASVVEYQFDGTAVTMKNSDSRNAR